MSVPAAGGTPSTLASGLHTPHDLAISTDNAFYTELGPAPNCSLGTWSGVNDVASMPLAPNDAGVDGSAEGGTSQTPTVVFTSNIGEVGRVTGLTLDPTGDVLVTTQDLCWPKGGMIYAVVPFANEGGVTVLSQAPPSSDRIETNTTTVTWASQDLISQVSRSGGAYWNVATETIVLDFVLASGFVYWTNPTTGEVLSQPVPASPPDGG